MAYRYLDVTVDNRFHVTPAKQERRKYSKGEDVFSIRPRVDRRQKLPHDPISAWDEVCVVAPIDCEIVSELHPDQDSQVIRLQAESDFPDDFRSDVYRAVEEIRVAYGQFMEESNYHVNYNQASDTFGKITLAGAVATFCIFLFVFGLMGVFQIAAAIAVWLVFVVVIIAVGLAIYSGVLINRFLENSRAAEEAYRNNKLLEDLGKKSNFGYDREDRVIERRIHFSNVAKKMTGQLAKRWG